MPDRNWYRDGLRFTCTQCGNCCTGPSGYVWFDESERSAMARKLGLSEAEFLRRHAHQVNGDWTLNERWNEAVRGYDCVFLARDERGRALCTIYDVRPQQCRTWPFWPENLRSKRVWQLTADRCPGMAAGLEGTGRLYPAEQIRIIRDSHPTG